MELKTKYQSSYFIYPYTVKEENFKNYLMKLLRNKKMKLQLFDKKSQLDLYNYFLPEVRAFLFPSFEMYEDKKRELKNMNPKMKATILAQYPCTIFDLKMNQDIQGKTDEENGIFFRISQVKIVCFNTGICFIAMKTELDDNSGFSDLLDFNYKFRDINSETSKLKNYENIHIQTHTFSDIKKLSDVIKEITGENSETKKLNIDTNRFLTYSYACVDQEFWSKKDEFCNVEKEFYKYSNILPSTFNSKFENDRLNVLKMGDFIKIGITKLGTTFFASSINALNYTHLTRDFENQFFYTYIITLYKRIFLKKILKDFKPTKNALKTKRKFIKFTKQIWIYEITNNDNGTLLHNELSKTFETEELYQMAKLQYDIAYKNFRIEKNALINKLLLLVLGMSLTLNIINFIILITL